MVVAYGQQDIKLDVQHLISPCSSSLKFLDNTTPTVPYDVTNRPRDRQVYPSAQQITHAI
jgi:hypothetical protein